MGDNRPSATSHAIGALSGTIGWITASIAGLTALGYSAGYFTIHQHLSMLGFSDIVEVTNANELVEGGRFFYLTLQQMAVGGVTIIVGTTALAATAWAIYQIPFVRKSRVSTRLGSAGVKGLFSELLPLFAIAIVAYHYNTYYQPATSVLSLQDLAFKSPRAQANTFGFEVGRMILTGDADDRSALVDSYNFFVRVYALFIAVTWLMVYNRSSTVFGRTANFLFVIYTFMLTAFLPLAFAVLVRTPIYPVAKLTLKDGQQAQGLVIQRNDRDMILWKPDTRSAVSFPRDAVTTYEVNGDRDIFNKHWRS